jgi:flavodoxin
MKKVLIVYKSKTGTTRKLGEEISKFINSKGVKAEIVSTADFSTEQLNDVSHLFLGCWTSGLFVFMQHPEDEWISFAKNLPKMDGVKVSLFTTYKLATGSMFSKMKKYLKDKFNNIDYEIKSRNSSLSESNKENIYEFVSA